MDFSIEHVLFPLFYAIAAAASAYAGAKARTEALTGRVTELESGLATVRDTVAAAGVKIGSLEQFKVDAVERLQNHWADVGTLRRENQEAHTAIADQIAELGRDLGEIKGSLSALSEKRRGG